MTVSELITRLQKLKEEGHADKDVAFICSASGAGWYIGSAFVKDWEGEGALDEGDKVVLIG